MFQPLATKIFHPLNRTIGFLLTLTADVMACLVVGVTSRAGMGSNFFFLGGGALARFQYLTLSLGFCRVARAG